MFRPEIRFFMRACVSFTLSNVCECDLVRRCAWSLVTFSLFPTVNSKHVGSKSFNDLDDVNELTPLSNGGVIVSGLRSDLSFHDPSGAHGVSSSDQVIGDWLFPHGAKEQQRR